MHRQFPALLALLLVVAAVGVAPTASGTAAEQSALRPVADEPNTTSYLALDEPVERSGFATPGLDVGGALAADNAVIHNRYERHRVDQRYRNARNDSARRVVLREAADELDARVARLTARERAARTAYNDGDISTATYLRRISVIHSEATALQTAAVRLSRRAEAAPGDPVAEERLAGFKARLTPLEGPVRERAGEAIAAREDRTRIYTETSNDGVVLAMVVPSTLRTGGQYVREAYIDSARTETASDQFMDDGDPDFEAVVTRSEELYPWVFERNPAYTVGLVTDQPYLYTAGVYAVGVNHPHGTDRRFDLVTYLDGGTTDVFREIQYKSTAQLPTERLGTNRTGGVNLSVYRTHAGGPMQAAVTDNASTPVNATVYVDGERIGSTDSDGERWFVAPRGTVNVTAVHEGERITVAGSPGDP